MQRRLQDDKGIPPDQQCLTLAESVDPLLAPLSPWWYANLCQALAGKTITLKVKYSDAINDVKARKI
ncbi:hypothetical protein BS17DRAFT_776720 [Gyrodon lividus]|nr:hypothetical protein BS17DRAFT_776720 [Gyrodon lividus]